MPEVKNIRVTFTKCCASCFYLSVGVVWEEDISVECDISGMEWDNYLNPKNDPTYDGPGNTICDAWVWREEEQS